MWFQFSGPPQKRGFGCTCILCLPRPERFWQPEAWRPLPGCGTPFPSAASGPGSQRFSALSPDATHLFPPQPQCAPLVRSQEVFRLEPGPVCRVGGGGFSGAEFAPCPSPCLLPPAGMGRLSSGVSHSLFFQTAGSVFGPVNFSLLSHSLKKAPSDCSQGLLSVLTLSNAAGSSPFRPLLLVAGAGVWGTFLLGVAFST